MAALVYWLRRRKREGKAALLDPGLFASKPYRLGVFQIFLQQVALGGMLIAGNPQHQHRRPAPLPSGCSDRHPPRRSHRSRQRIPHDAPTRTTAVDRLGGCSPRLNLRRGPGVLTVPRMRGRLRKLPSGFSGFLQQPASSLGSPAALTLAGAGVGVPHPGVWTPSTPEVCRRA
jgi:hypothetical protein